jgi:alpha-D-ribose 1-methylphosphonate 5-triphosphate synthase subunit PhnG
MIGLAEGHLAMNRSRRTRILIEGSPELRRELCRQVEESRRVATVDESGCALVMLKLRETARNGLFYIGELLVTEAKVRVEGAIGIGIVSGDRPEAARELAVVDAACNAGLAEVSEWEDLLLEEEKRIARRESVEASRVALTKVAFESMDKA